MKKVTKRELIDDLKVLINSLYGHLPFNECCKLLKELTDKVNKITGISQIKVDVTINLDKTSINKTYLITDLSKNGLDLPEDVESFELVMSALTKCEHAGVKTSSFVEIFKTDKFVVESNAKSKNAKTKEIKEKQGTEKITHINKELYQEMSGNRIRFGENQTLQV